jgi:hypothetical protein
MIFVPNAQKPTKHNRSYVAEVFVVFGAKIAGYGSCGYFASGLNIISIVLQ